MVERAKSGADFRLVIVKGRVYIEQYRKSFQTRDLFTWWGILHLLKKYPGRLPDLDLMFHCDDWPVIRVNDYQQPKAIAPPQLFQYYGNDWSLGMVFPDWSFWGWVSPLLLIMEEETSWITDCFDDIGWKFTDTLEFESFSEISDEGDNINPMISIDFLLPDDLLE
ncbi:hypothetical protein NE237_022167 [Protea cynaroides]|uniref:Glycosyl transferase CAP10 domain-containing protein n=1 Tax=Protea cynaroides TaxID=273540 RepID=A0A9Q0HCK1_9MAGN|nr:hypothetical protein NE237_022167 [Protea cynaroides]